mgnify:CR=1 FL=1
MCSGECVWVKEPLRGSARLSEGFLSGVWLWRSEESDEHLVWARDEIAQDRTIQRKATEAEMYDKALVRLMTTKRPWEEQEVEWRKKPTATATAGHTTTAKLRIRQLTPKSEIPHQGHGGDENPGCLGCAQIEQRHSDACKERFMAFHVAKAMG